MELTIFDKFSINTYSDEENLYTNCIEIEQIGSTETFMIHEGDDTDTFEYNGIPYFFRKLESFDFLEDDTNEGVFVRAIIRKGRHVFLDDYKLCKNGDFIVCGSFMIVDEDGQTKFGKDIDKIIDKYKTREPIERFKGIDGGMIDMNLFKNMIDMYIPEKGCPKEDAFVVVEHIWKGEMYLIWDGRKMDDNKELNDVIVSENIESKTITIKVMYTENGQECTKEFVLSKDKTVCEVVGEKLILLEPSNKK
ncbi:hypothetical protein JDS99_28480 [Bacillus cereus group sp. N6]|uniref:hypothetical protein n=1 Tax=Bacillus cereus group sp. N6 TaxID=2794583 RepID=UPI0018F3905D|nr:hypothetical protein [Bacillus cereus group sp. N6]MBJ8113490.1 hypothetical protein [Bacillus cereus group sp. N6]